MTGRIKARTTGLFLCVSWMACSSSTPPIDTQPQDSTTDTGEEKGGIDPGWVIGEIEPCSTPNTWGYIDASEQLDDIQDYIAKDERGVIATWEEDGETWFFHTMSSGNLSRRRIGKDRSINISLEDMVRGFTASDLDQDGRVDLIAVGRSVSIIWSATDDVPESQELMQYDAIYDVIAEDIDSDGDIDLLLATNSDPGQASQDPLWILFNEGERTFSDPVIIEASTSKPGTTFDMTLFDENQDGHLDLYVCNDHGGTIHSNQLLLGDSKGGFVEATTLGIDIATDCMGASIADWDHSQSLDVIVTAIDRPHLLLSEAGSYYTASQTTLPAHIDEQMSWGSAGVDVDNDGLLDLLMATSDFSRQGHIPYPLWLFHQQNDGSFVEIGASLGLPTEAATRGLLSDDFNNDGVLDFYVSDFMRSPWLFLSEGCTDKNWLEVSAPHGSLLTVETEDKKWTHLVSNDPGYGASQNPIAHVGLGPENLLKKVTLVLPGGETVAIRDPLEARRRLRWVAPTE